MRIKSLFSIEDLFSTSSRTIYTSGNLKEIFNAHKRAWNLPKEMDEESFIRLILRRTQLKRLVLHSQHYPSLLRYTWGPYGPLSIALSIRSQGYFSHETALWIHGCLETSNNIYVNREQSEKSQDPEPLVQSAIDRAFRNNPRCSKLTYTYGTASTITVLSGKNSKELEVKEIKSPSGETVRATSLERTLIDITVRPQYAGGVKNVVSAFQFAKGQISVNRLLEILKKLNYVYPYQQSIGFYLKRSGYSETDISLARKTKVDLNFYLDYAMKEPGYDTDFKIFYPRELESPNLVPTTKAE